MNSLISAKRSYSRVDSVFPWRYERSLDLNKTELLDLLISWFDFNFEALSLRWLSLLFSLELDIDTFFSVASSILLIGLTLFYVLLTSTGLTLRGSGSIRNPWENDYTPRADKLSIFWWLSFDSELVGLAFFNLFIFLGVAFCEELTIDELVCLLNIKFDKGYSTICFCCISITIGVSVSDALLGLGSLTWISIVPLTASEREWLLFILFLLKSWLPETDPLLVPGLLDPD